MSGALATSRASHRAGPDPESRRPIKLMIVDDSMVARAVLSRMIDADGNFEIAGIAGTAEDAIEALGQVMVDIVLLDLEMPGVGGLEGASAHSRSREGRQGPDRLVARRRGSGGNRRRAGAWRRGHAAEAGHGPVQRSLLRSAAGQAARSWLCRPKFDPARSAHASCRRSSGRKATSR